MAFQLLHLQGRAIALEPRAAVKLLLHRCQPRNFRLLVAQLQLVCGQFFLRRRLLCHQVHQRLMILLQALALLLCISQIPGNFCGLVRLSSRPGHPQIILRLEQLPVRFRKLRRGIFDVQLHQQLAFFHLLSFTDVDFLDERIQFRAHYVRRDGFDLSIAADGRNQVLAHRRHGGNLRGWLASAQPDQDECQHRCQEQVEQNPVSQLSVHDFLFRAFSLSALEECENTLLLHSPRPLLGS